MPCGASQDKRPHALLWAQPMSPSPSPSPTLTPHHRPSAPLQPFPPLCLSPSSPSNPSQFGFCWETVPRMQENVLEHLPCAQAAWRRQPKAFISSLSLPLAGTRGAWPPGPQPPLEQAGCHSAGRPTRASSGAGSADNPPHPPRPLSGGRPSLFHGGLAPGGGLPQGSPGGGPAAMPPPPPPTPGRASRLVPSPRPVASVRRWLPAAGGRPRSRAVGVVGGTGRSAPSPRHRAWVAEMAAA